MLSPKGKQVLGQTEWLTIRLSDDNRRLYDLLFELRKASRDEPFPVDFETLWSECYKQKAHAKRDLVASSIEGEDYKLSRSGEGTMNHVEKIHLSL